MCRSGGRGASAGRRAGQAPAGDGRSRSGLECRWGLGCTAWMATVAAPYSILSASVMAYVPRIRLFVEAPLTGGTSIALSEAQGHYLTHVMRAGPGTRVLAFNGS